jgi:DNA-binding PadR family transcriptional regulator
MPSRRRPSSQTIAVLRALLSRPQEWRYGYELAKEVGLKSGTLYPLLMRLTDEGLLQSEWHPAARPGLPQRHAYRLTQQGVAFARESAELGGTSVRTGMASA